MIIFDNHLHLRRHGRFIDAIRDFEKTGGTHFVLCQYPHPEKALENNSYKKNYDETVMMAKEVEEKTSVTAYITVGPYPVDYLFFKKRIGGKKAVTLMKKGMDEAAFFCEEYDKCIGIGEIGRPHFDVDEKIFEDSNEILLYGMKCAKEVDVPVVLHTESTTPQTCEEFVEMGKKTGLSADKIVKHYSPPLILENENFGLMPSVLASKKNIGAAVKKGFRFMMETDYIDDPKRPGAVLGPKTVPKRTKQLLEDGIVSEKEINMIHKINPEKTYGIELKE
jgi:TatD-related deoxyribonuclease